MAQFKIDREERRRSERTELALRGRYMLRDGHEYPCWTLNISASGVAIIGLEKGYIGERVVAYINRIGRIEGTIARHFDECFAIEVEAPALKREKLAQQIARLVAHRTPGAPDRGKLQGSAAAAP